jgi:hypothetical protein
VNQRNCFNFPLFVRGTINANPVSRTAFTLKATLFRLFCLLVATFGTIPLLPAQAAPSSIIGPNEVFRFEVHKLKCNNADEDGAFSDGDEPYVVAAIISPDLFAGYVLNVTASSVFANVDRGDTRDPNLTLAEMHVEGPVAMIVQVVEEDGTGRRAMLNAARRAANNAFVGELRLGTRDLHRIAYTVKVAMNNSMYETAFDSVDSDEMVDFPTVFFIGYDELDRITANGSLSQSAERMSTGVRYTVTIKVSRTQ